jgi:hypothetical protein
MPGYKWEYIIVQSTVTSSSICNLKGNIDSPNMERKGKEEEEKQNRISKF